MIENARLYLVSTARLPSGVDLVDLVGELAGAGVGAIQLREKDMEATDLVRAGEPIHDACRAAGIPFILNDRADIALALGADGVHVGQNDLSVGLCRRILGTGAIVGLSTHAPHEIDLTLGAPDRSDYIAVGPVHATPTKPGRPATGLDLVRYAAEHVSDLPWFAIGGINSSNVGAAMEAGARRIVVVRAITEARDPVAAAADLSAELEAGR
ncbi:MAG: thiamine phosphate synthase [Actinomycetota bacterium]